MIKGMSKGRQKELRKEYGSLVKESNIGVVPWSEMDAKARKAQMKDLNRTTQEILDEQEEWNR